MAGKDPKKLRAQAKRLIDEADRIETVEATTIGKFVLRAGYNLETIKSLIDRAKEA